MDTNTKCPSKKNIRRIATVVIFSIAIVCCILAAWYVGVKRRIPFVKRVGEYSIGIYTGKSPFDLLPCPEVNNPVLTARDVTDISAGFVADPFMVRENGMWYMFFEVWNNSTEQGDIGLAVSKDGCNWAYKQIVLDESFHLSYPNVFKWNDEYYMIPETRIAYAVRLYKAVDFPGRWEYVKDMVTGNYLDPSIFHDGRRWWMFVSERCDVLHLFYADELTGDWVRHPESPVVTLDGNIARPGGPILQYDGRVYRFTQDCDPTYGNQVRAFEITELTTDSYKEMPVPGNPILKATGQGWNATQMHHMDPHQVDGAGWIASVDGYGKSLLFGFEY